MVSTPQEPGCLPGILQPPQALPQEATLRPSAEQQVRTGGQVSSVRGRKVRWDVVFQFLWLGELRSLSRCPCYTVLTVEGTALPYRPGVSCSLSLPVRKMENLILNWLPEGCDSVGLSAASPPAHHPLPLPSLPSSHSLSSRSPCPLSPFISLLTRGGKTRCAPLSG